MTSLKWTLIDPNSEKIEEKKSQPGDVVGARAESVSAHFRTLRGGLRDGVQLLSLKAGELAVDLLPTRGMSLWKAWLGKHEYGWKSPVRGPVHPAHVDLGEPSGLGWLDGFDELLVRCGLESNGAPEFDDNHQLRYPLHGRIGNRPAHHLEVEIDGEKGTVVARGVVEETRFHFLKLRMTSTLSLDPDNRAIHIQDRIDNLSSSPAEAQMLYHVNFGLPLLDAGSQFSAPIKTLVPRNAHAAEGIGNWNGYTAPEAGFEEQVYFMELLDKEGKTQTLLKNAHSTQGVSIHCNKKQLPCYTVWKNTTAASDGYVTGLEPGTNFPNPRTYEGQQKRVAQLAGGGSIEFDIQLQLHNQPAHIEAADKAIAALQSQAQPQIYKAPQPGWCEGA